MLPRRLHRTLVLLAFLGLGLSLTSLFGWGVIGKHRLDHVARDVYKATRAIPADPVLLDLNASSVTVRGDIPPAVEDAGDELRTLSCELPPRPSSSFSPSRAPPSA